MEKVMTETERATPEKILLVDDDDFYLGVLKSQVESLGDSKVDTCSASQNLFEILEHDQVDLIFLDINMPDTDGIELMRSLSNSNFSGAVVILSGEDTRILETVEKLARAHNLDLVGCLAKPVTLENLERTLEKCKFKGDKYTSSLSYQISANDISEAIGKREFVMFYQPQVRVADGEFVGVEALIRWDHPKYGLILPEHFIRISEENDLISSVTELVLEMAIHQSSLWQDDDIRTRVSINISMDDLLELDFPDNIITALSSRGMQPADLALELTESKLMSNVTSWLDILARLRLKRIGLSIDDFGTGHSSLSKLHDLPFTELKIDKSFVRRAHSNEASSAIVSGSQSIAERLNMHLVAEGVEDFEDWCWIKQQNCEMAQGFFIGRPMPAEKLPDWIKDWETRIADLV